MNLYQALNQNLRDFKVQERKSLIESEECEKKLKDSEDAEALNEERKGLEDQLEQTTSEIEKKKIQERLDEINKLLSKELEKECDSNIKDGENCDNCNKEDTDIKDGENCKECKKEAETTIEVPVKVEVGGNEVVNPEVTPTEPTETPEDEVMEDSELKEHSNDTINEAIGIVESLISTLNDEGSIDETICKEKLETILGFLKSDLDEGDNCEDCKKDEELTECEVKSFKVTRIAPSKDAYMIEAETSKGLRYFIGKGFNKESGVLNEAEEFDDKAKASDKFKSLLK